MAASDAPDNQSILAALKHPLRRAILRAMNDDEPVSPRELADQLEESLSNVSYHVRVLNEAGVLGLVEEKPVRGATQHFYRWLLKPKWLRQLLGEDEK